MHIKFDCHCHSRYSDGSAKVSQIEERCLKEDLGVALTDHNEIRGSLELFEACKIPTVLGIEVGTKEGLEFLMYFRRVDQFVYFFKSQVEQFRYPVLQARSSNSVYNILDCAKGLETFISLAHPYSFGRRSVLNHEKDPNLLDFVYRNIHAIEIYNGTLSTNRNYQALELQKKLNKGITIGSDSHDLKSIGRVSMSFELTKGIDHDELYKKFQTGAYESLEKNGDMPKIKTLSVISSKYTTSFFKNKILGLVKK